MLLKVSFDHLKRCDCSGTWPEHSFLRNAVLQLVATAVQLAIALCADRPGCGVVRMAKSICDLDVQQPQEGLREAVILANQSAFFQKIS